MKCVKIHEKLSKQHFPNLGEKNKQNLQIAQKHNAPPRNLIDTSALEYKVLQFCTYDIRILTFHIQMQHFIAKLSKLYYFITSQSKRNESIEIYRNHKKSKEIRRNQWKCIVSQEMHRNIEKSTKSQQN